jgi:PKD repeat protein
MIRSFHILILLLYCQCVFSQLPNGSVAPDFDVEDINGNTFSLYAMMGSNKSACIAFEATWCSFCWHFHTSGVLSQVYNTLGASTTVVMLESDWNTNTDCLYGPSGCNNYTHGDWVTGTPYQIANLSATNGPTVADDYNRAYYPMLYVISPDKRTWEILERTYQNYNNWITKSFALNATANLTHSTCGDNGKIALTVTGGYSTISYKWSNGATTKDLNNIPGGTYNVTISDANSYFKVFGPYTINGPSKRVDVTSSELTHVKCYSESSGSISLQLDYGTPPYTYNWSNGKKTNDIDNLSAGNYSLTISDNASCTRLKTFVINQPADLQLTAQSSKENCDNIDGSILIKPTGGTMPYSYNLGEGNQSNPEFKNLMGGRNYTITVTDNNACTETIKVFVDITHKPKVDAGNDLPIDCIVDLIKLDGSNSDQGTSFSSLWTTQNGNIVKGEKTLTPEVNLPGIYYHSITDLNNKCINIDSVRVIDHRDFPDIEATGDTLFNCLFKETEIKGITRDSRVIRFWKKQYDSTFIQFDKSITVKDSGNYIFHVKDTLNLCLIRDTVFIEANYNLPEIQVKPVNDLSCKNLEVVIDATGSAKGPGIGIKWSTKDGSFVKGESSFKPTVNKPGLYLLTLSDSANYCSNEIEIHVLEQTTPVAAFNDSLAGFEMNFFDKSLGLPKHWHWDFGDGDTSLLQNPIHVYKSEGDYTICLIIFNDCGSDTICKTIAVTKPADLQLTCPANSTEATCQTQASINAKFVSWLGTAAISGGCNAAIINNNSGAPSACGGFTTVKFTATSSCDATITCSANFNVLPASVVYITCPPNVTEAPCQSQVVIDGKFEAWVSSASVSGGCNTKLTVDQSNPPSACGGSTLATFIVTSTCEGPKTCNALFYVTPAPKVVFDCPLNQIEEAGQKQEVIDSKFAIWLGAYSLKGGCNPVLSNNNSGAPPNTGGIATVTFTVVSDCESPVSCTSTFEVKETSSENPVFLRRFELIPNPIHSKGIIDLQFDKKRQYEISLVDIYGKIVWTYNADQSESTIPVDFMHFPKGMYYVVLKSENTTLAKKWILQ